MRWCELAERLTVARSLPDGIVEWALEHITDGLFIDGGAHVGLFCIPILLACPEARCVAFEPNPTTRRALHEMATLNGVADRLTVHSAALFDYTSTKVLKVPLTVHECGLSTLGEPKRFDGYHTETVRTRILDSYALVPQLIKLDLEGAELYALSGAVETIMSHWPAIVTEAYAANTAQFGYEPREIKAFLEALGYNCLPGREDLFCTT
jgi:FkbM family methyltransferase